MEIEELQMTIADLTSVEPRSIGNDAQAHDAALWVDFEKKMEADADALLDPAIKLAYKTHRDLTGEKKNLIEKLIAAKARVRYNLANWISGGRSVDGCYIKTTWRVTVNDPDMVPEEYAYRSIDEKKISEWVKLTGGTQAVPGCTIEPVNVLYSSKQ